MPEVKDGSALDVEGIMERIPHRFPFLMIDEIVRWEAETFLEARKAITIDEPFFEGHFPGQPVFPGVLQIEAAAQSSAALVFLTTPDRSDLLVFAQVKRFTFLEPVYPGTVLDIRVETEVMRGDSGIAKARLSVEGTPVAKGTLAFGSMPRLL